MYSLNKGSFQVYFVQEAGKSKDKAHTSMKKAYVAMEENDFGARWITTEDVLRRAPSAQPEIFVCDPFEGKAYEHLCSTQQRIFGPLCILACLKHGDPLPTRPHPVYSVCMRRTTVTCSTMDASQRAEVKRKIHLMCGTFSKDLIGTVTHLVTCEVGSRKYRVAVQCKIPIMLPEWIEECWNNAQHKFRPATDASAFSAFVCPPFRGLIISVSQIEGDERKKIQVLISRNGGKYSGPMKAKETTHLVLLQPQGDKYKFAVPWKVPCVKPAWLYASIEAGVALDESQYCLDEKNSQIHGSSTPKKGQRMNTTLLTDCSTITNVSLSSRIDETAMTDFSIASEVPPRNTSSVVHPLDVFDVTGIPKNCQFLDGCRIFPYGFSGSQMDKVQRIINAGGGTRYGKLSESVTHVVVNSKSDVHKLPDVCDTCARVVSFHWLVECCSNRSLVDESKYLCMENVPFSPHKSPIGLKTVSENVETSTIHGLTTDASIDYDELMKQYMPSDCTDQNVETVTAREETVLREDEMVKKNDASVISNDLRDSTIRSEAIDSESLFGGMVFCVSGFDSEHQQHFKEMIQTNGGIVNSGQLSSTDFEVVPLIRDRSAVRHIPTGKNVITNCWLQMSLEQEEILPLDQNPLFKQVVVDMSALPLHNCVLSISQYQGTERDSLMHLSEALGATCQEYFLKTVNKTRGLQPNTHLIVEEPEGSKYEAAKKWKIPAVTKDWLLATAHTDRKADENDFLVDSETRPIKTFGVSEDGFESVNKVSSDKAGANGNAAAMLEVDSASSTKEASVDSSKGSSKLGCETKSNDKEAKNPIVVVEAASIENENPQHPPTMSAKRSLDFPDSTSKFGSRYDLEEIMGCFDSPRPSSSAARRSLGIAELFSRNMAIACKNLGIDKSFSSELCGARVLKGVILYVSRKLANRQSELNSLCKDLGGDYLWSYDTSCTHFVYQGKVSDLNKELRLAKEQGKNIVHPEWLLACRDEETHVDESQYPSTFNPRLCISSQAQGGGEITTCRQRSPKEAEEKKTTALQEDGNGDHTGSSEMLCDVSKQLQELMTATKSAMVERRRTRRTNSSSGSQSPADSGARARTTPVPSRLQSSNHQEPLIDPQPSQSVPISWDDPTGRMEREKIAEQLSRIVDTQSTQQTQEAAIPEEETRAFIFSGITDPEKKEYTSIVQRLGGIVLDGKEYNDTSTHLVISTILKNEKFLSSVAAGKWVLLKSYIEESGRARQFVDEERHEWGGPGTTRVPEKLKESALCPRRWRLHVQKTQTRAFHNWRVIVVAEQGVKLETYRRILQAGGATVLPVTCPYDRSQKATMAIVELNKNSQIDLDYKGLASAGVKCVKPEYLALFLVEKNPPLLERYLVAPPYDNSFRKRKPNQSTRSPKRNRQ